MWAVDKFMDALKERPDADCKPGSALVRYEYFESEAEAKKFIRKRAIDAVQDAQRALANANARHAKVMRKFA
jgi:hypothetical protein